MKTRPFDRVDFDQTFRALEFVLDFLEPLLGAINETVQEYSLVGVLLMDANTSFIALGMIPGSSSSPLRVKVLPEAVWP